MGNKQIDRLPDEFASYEAAADFWDTHDTTDYSDEFETVLLETELEQRHFEIKIDEDLMEMLYKQAQQQGVAMGKLASDIIREAFQKTA